jgi:hypothetical protein
MNSYRGLSDELLNVLKSSKAIRVRAGTGKHRFIGIWFVIVADRIFARSWSVKPHGWYRTFLKEPCGAIQVRKVEIPVRAVHTRSKRLREAVDRGYLEKYHSGYEVKYAKDLTTEKSRATTVEFVPLPGSASRSQMSTNRHLLPGFRKKLLARSDLPGSQ